MLSFVARGSARVLVNFTTSICLSVSFNLAILFIYHQGEGGARRGWAAALEDEVASRSIVCTLDSLDTSVANLLQSLATVTALF
jgi:hypothetical protein